MILPGFEYRKATSVADAIALYNDFEGKARYLAGGTDLMPLLKYRLAAPAAIIDLKGIEELKAIAAIDGWLTIGANVTLFELKNHPVVKEYFPLLYQSLDATSCETLQMRATIGGNLLQDTRCIEYNKSLEWRAARGFCLKMGGKCCNVVPHSRVCLSNYCSDNALSLVALSAEADLAEAGGEKTAGLEKIYTGSGSKPFVVEPGTLLTRIRIPLEKSKGVYEKLRVRNSIDYPLAAVAVAMKKSVARVCVGGVGPAPLVYELAGTDEGTLRDAANSASTDARAVPNAILSPAYRKKMVGVLFRRAVQKVLREGA
ncbi:MAG: FAD binding domain-containing protein [Syntrophobacteraceae bacterium]|nr:FAD binding domain-containing protein [Syntrophobacteraceae bacterium]